MPTIFSGQEISELIQKVDSRVDSGEQKQPAGFDVSASRIFAYPKDRFVLSIAKPENSKLTELRPNTDNLYELETGAYFVELNEITTIPKDAIGILLPRSTLLMLVCAFAGKELILSAYAEAVQRGFRFYSYGDAMFIV